MKILTVALAVVSVTHAFAFQGGVEEPTVGKVVEFLSKMLEKSKSEGEAEEKIYAKFKCYCDENDETVSAELKKLSEDISLLGSDIEGIQAANGELSTACAKLKADIADNEESQDQATEIRSKASEQFKAETADLSKGIRTMQMAIQILQKVGADQTDSETRDRGDHGGFMKDQADFLQASQKGKKRSASLLGVGADVKHALEAAFALIPPENRPATEAFLQGPFTGSYSSQSGAVVGILKSMKGTFESNLFTATKTEEDDAKAKEELRRRAREWVNMTVPMQTVDDEDKSQATPPDSAKNFDIWDSDEEGVATRMRQEAQPEAGAGADEPTPFFMQVLAKQFGKT